MIYPHFEEQVEDEEDQDQDEEQKQEFNRKQHIPEHKRIIKVKKLNLFYHSTLRSIQELELQRKNLEISYLKLKIYGSIQDHSQVIDRYIDQLAMLTVSQQLVIKNISYHTFTIVNMIQFAYDICKAENKKNIKIVKINSLPDKLNLTIKCDKLHKTNILSQLEELNRAMREINTSHNRILHLIPRLRCDIILTELTFYKANFSESQIQTLSFSLQLCSNLTSFSYTQSVKKLDDKYIKSLGLVFSSIRNLKSLYIKLKIKEQKDVSSSYDNFMSPQLFSEEEESSEEQLSIHNLLKFKSMIKGCSLIEKASFKLKLNCPFQDKVNNLLSVILWQISGANSLEIEIPKQCLETFCEGIQQFSQMQSLRFHLDSSNLNPTYTNLLGTSLQQNSQLQKLSMFVQIIYDKTFYKQWFISDSIINLKVIKELSICNCKIQELKGWEAQSNFDDQLKNLFSHDVFFQISFYLENLGQINNIQNSVSVLKKSKTLRSIKLIPSERQFKFFCKIYKKSNQKSFNQIYKILRLVTLKQLFYK